MPADPPPEFSIRRVREADTARVRDLHEAALRDAGGYVEGAPEPDLEDVVGSYIDEGGEFLVGSVDGEIVAMGAYRPLEGYLSVLFEDDTAGVAEAKRMRVDPDHQGRGYGQALYDELERRAREAGFTCLVLDTTPAQTAAREFVEVNGFELVASETVQPGEEPFELLVYRKDLD